MPPLVCFALLPPGAGDLVLFRALCFSRGGAWRVSGFWELGFRVLCAQDVDGGLIVLGPLRFEGFQFPWRGKLLRGVRPGPNNQLSCSCSATSAAAASRRACGSAGLRDLG